MAFHQLSQHFKSFFGRLNPGASFESKASSEYNSIKGLIENPQGAAAVLSPTCFLQGSYRQQTAIYSINDVDIVALCQLCQPGSGSGRSYARDEIFETIAAPLRLDGRYRTRLEYGPQSMCIKIDLGIKVEILPVVYKTGTNDPAAEPFRLWRPESRAWEDGYARDHQRFLTRKNDSSKTEGNFIPAIKLLKHLRSKDGIDAVSFHIECLLFSLPDPLFMGSMADCIPAVLQYLASTPADNWFMNGCKTPCGERNIFSDGEWSLDKWRVFHNMVGVWANAAEKARSYEDKNVAIKLWQILLGDNYFPAQPST